MKFNILTLFPEIFPGPLGIGLIGKALNNNVFSINSIDLKGYSKNGRIDNRPCGGGPGMIIQANVLEKCFIDNKLEDQVIFFLSPGGIVFNQDIANKMINNFTEINILCGRYEGIDERLFKNFHIIEISIGDFILCGGEIASMVIIETIVRLIPDVLHNSESVNDESFNCNLLEHGHYTLPKIWHNISVPDILFTGHHENIKKWRLNESMKKTLERRNDLFILYTLDFICCLILKCLMKMKS